MMDLLKDIYYRKQPIYEAKKELSKGIDISKDLDKKDLFEQYEKTAHI